MALVTLTSSPSTSSTSLAGIRDEGRVTIQGLATFTSKGNRPRQQRGIPLCWWGNIPAKAHSAVVTPHNRIRFALDFVCYNDDIAFRFNPRFEEGKVVCNTMQNKIWGSEERKHNMPFQLNTKFEIVVLVMAHAFQVSVNGQHLLEYRHRVPYENIQSLEVTGDLLYSAVSYSSSGPSVSASSGSRVVVNQNLVSVQMGPSVAVSSGSGAVVPQKAPITVYNPVMPFQAALPTNFDINGKIIIMGNTAHGADRFHVNLLNRLTRNIHLQVNPRFREGAIVRNTQDRGKWGPEERQISYMPFQAGQSFLLEIRNEGGSFGVYSTGTKLFNYVHRLPFNQIDMIEVGGDITLTFVQY
ncbi:galectin-9-like [Bufo gargarizans]|uniref:galectin-9-like n=1 Tax=Bufo gargarizans TaxID=30331 RepID=UPI001CF4087F|nr:galectin-9-like [Bufo gargarizans]